MKLIYANFRIILCFVTLIAHVVILILNYIFREQGKFNELTFTIVLGVTFPIVLTILTILVDANKNKNKKYEESSKIYLTILYMTSVIMILAHSFGSISLIVREANSPDDLSHFIRLLFFFEALVPLAISDIFRNTSQV